MIDNNDAMGQMALETYRVGAAGASLPDHTLRRLTAPQRVIELEMPTADGCTARLWRVQHNADRGATKGGLRIGTDVNRSEATALAMLMTLKTAVADLPLGGGKGALLLPEDLDEEERTRILRLVGERLGPSLGAKIDVLGPDVGSSADDMDRIDRAWRDATDAPTTDLSTTGRSTDAGGIAARKGATAAGVRVAFEEALERTDLTGSLRVAIEGFGGIGVPLARDLAADGHTIVAVSDSSGALIDTDGLDVEAAADAKEGGTQLAEFGDTVDSHELFSVDCDVLVPSALQSVIDADTADQIRASVILEASNGPCTIDGNRRLAERTITVVPDIVTNAGGVIVSWYEMEVNAGNLEDDTDQLRSDMADRLRATHERVWKRAGDDSVSLREAAAALALEAVASAAR